MEIYKKKNKIFNKKNTFIYISLNTRGQRDFIDILYIYRNSKLIEIFILFT